MEGKEIYLTHHEFETLLFLTRHPKQVFTKRQIYEAVWDDIPVSVDAKVECMIYSIRKKLRAYTDRETSRPSGEWDTDLIREHEKEPSVRAAQSHLVFAKKIVHFLSIFFLFFHKQLLQKYGLSGFPVFLQPFDVSDSVFVLDDHRRQICF